MFRRIRWSIVADVVFRYLFLLSDVMMRMTIVFSALMVAFGPSGPIASGIMIVNPADGSKVISVLLGTAVAIALFELVISLFDRKRSDA